MMNKLWAVLLFLMVVFSLSLTTGYQKTSEKTGEVKDETAGTKSEINRQVVKIFNELTVGKVQRKSAETAEEINEKSAESINKAPVVVVRENTSKTAEEIVEEDRTIVNDIPGKDIREQVIEPAVKINKMSTITVKEVTVEGVTVKEVTIKGGKDIGIEDEDDDEYVEPGPSVTQIMPAPALIAQPDYDDTESVTLQWNAVINPYGNSVNYFVRLYNANVGFIYPSGWISGTSWTTSIPGRCNYSWQVKASDNVYLQESEWSTPDSFAVNAYCSGDEG